MAHLQLKQLNGSQTEELIDIEERITIGRHSNNDLILRFDNISRYHCVIYVDEEHNIFVKDLNSANGTYLNDERIERAQVHEHDLLQIGPKRFVFIVADEFDTSENNAPSVVTYKSLFLHPSFKQKIQHVQIQSVEDHSQKFMCPVNTISTIGRFQFSDIFLDDLSVSRHHAILDVRENRVLLSDSSSMNGTFVNGERITQQELHNGDTFSIGKTHHFFISITSHAAQSLTLLEQSPHFSCLDVLDNSTHLLEALRHQYGDEVFAEVGRQTHILWEEFEQTYQQCNNVETKRTGLLKWLRLLSHALHVLDNTTLKAHILENRPLERCEVEFLQRIELTLPKFERHRILYFEEAEADSIERIYINGFLVNFSPDFQVLLLGIPYDYLLYLFQVAPWLARLHRQS